MKPNSLLIFIIFIFTFIHVLDSRRTSNNICSHDNIHFPFKLNSVCKHNQTIIKFRGYGELGVKSISHDPNKLTLTDPKDCVFEVFMNLDLDTTPFRYYHVVKSYMYLNCTSELSGSFEEVPCLSGYDHHVYVEESSLDVPHSCEVVKRVLIPFAYSAYVSDDSFGLDLTWDSSGVKPIIEDLGVVMLVFVIIGLGCVKVFCWKKSRSDDHEWEQLLGDLENL